jgi:hypothetical protein
MSIIKQIQVNAHYTRSINLERDADSLSIVKSYIPTTRALKTLESIVESLKQEECPRAWSLVGPYGSGKSSFGIFLTHVLGSPDEEPTHLALKKLRKNDKKLANKYTKLNEYNEGFCSVLITGSPEPLSRRLVGALLHAATNVWSKRPGRVPAVINTMQSLVEDKALPSASKILDCIKRLQKALERIDYNGLLIVVDELGKFLEYEARHYGSNDIFLLQSLAEHALANHHVKLALVVMLHQSFDQYARGLGDDLRNEWTKVQGRFESIPFLESAEQTLRVVAAAISHHFSNDEKDLIAHDARRMASILATANALPGSMDTTTAEELFAQCYPLHPVSVLLLPLLCQKVAQNERTLFSYLGSREAYGFQDSISRCQQIGDWILPNDIYEYFVLNQSSALFDHFTHRRWAEVITAIERLDDAPNSQVQLLKTIGLFNIIGPQGGLKASNNIIELFSTENSPVSYAVNALVERSVIKYRKFSAEYRVWEGSDFDLDDCLNAEIEKIGPFNLVDCLNSRHQMPPVVARKYTIQNGALRYFEPTFGDFYTKEQLEISKEARIVFFFTENEQDKALFLQQIYLSSSPLDIYVLCVNGSRLRSAVAEVLALENIQKTAQALHTDPVAQREFKDRYHAAIQQEKYLLDQLIAEPQLNQWYWNTQPLQIHSKRALQGALSTILHTVYDKSPVFHNELINRNKPSSQANAGKKKLALAMLLHENEADLGIDKFPPEKSIYRACLRASKLHVLSNNGLWRFQGPLSASEIDDPCRIFPAWQRVDDFLTSTENKPQSLIELNLELIAPPYGVKAGMLPILYLTVLMANRQNLALYEESVYLPYWEEEHIERFLKRPDNFTVQRFNLDGLNQDIFNVYAHSLLSGHTVYDILDLAKALAGKLQKLPAYTRTTKNVSIYAKGIRDAFELSKSPIKLLLEDLPKLLGVHLADAENPSDTLDTFAQRLDAGLEELDKCLKQLKVDLCRLLAPSYDSPKTVDLNKLRHHLCQQCECLSDHSSMDPGLKAYVQRLSDREIDANEWLNNVLNFLGRKPVHKWSDTDLALAKHRVQELNAKLNEMIKVYGYYQRVQSKQDYNDHSKQKTIDETKKSLLSTINNINDKELEMEILAEFLKEFFAQPSSESSRSQNIVPENVKRH